MWHTIVFPVRFSPPNSFFRFSRPLVTLMPSYGAWCDLVWVGGWPHLVKSRRGEERWWERKSWGVAGDERPVLASLQGMTPPLVLVHSQCDEQGDGVVVVWK